MKQIIFYFLLVVFAGNSLSAQYLDFTGEACALGKQKMSNAALRSKNASLYPGDANIDVHYYFLDMHIDPEKKFLKGAVQIDFTANTAALSSFKLDLNTVYQVDSVYVNGAPAASFVHSSNVLTVNLKTAVSKGDQLETKVIYHGFPPQNVNEPSIVFSNTPFNDKVIWTLSEPYNAPSWWPCVDNQADKADSCDVWITLPKYYTAVSQGLLQDLKENADGTQTAKWKHRYPISHYLISIAASNYVKQERYYKTAAKDSMPILDYVYPGLASNPNLAPLLDQTADFLTLFSEKYGEYPFIKEKYGHAMFGFGGGMEHQTISSMGAFSFGLISHELAHQWFGDKVTCKTWRDIWVNEGFAEFSALYALEQLVGKSSYQDMIAEYMAASKNVSGSVAIENTASVNTIFNYAKTYQKGSVVLHMLRGVLGDEVFFKVLKEYQNTEFAYGAASIEDFQMVAERVYGQSLDWFFAEWLFGYGYPKYQFGWQQVGTILNLSVDHSPSNNHTPTFTMPIEIQINFEDGTTQLEKILVDRNQQVIQLETQSKAIKEVEFDPNNLILKDLLNLTGNVVLGLEQEVEFSIYPNPSSDYLKWRSTDSDWEEIRVIDGIGRVWLTKDKINLTGENILNIKNLPAGRYFINLRNAERSFTKSFVKQN